MLVVLGAGLLEQGLTSCVPCYGYLSEEHRATTHLEPAPELTGPAFKGDSNIGQEQYIRPRDDKPHKGCQDCLLVSKECTSVLSCKNMAALASACILASVMLLRAGKV